MKISYGLENLRRLEKTDTIEIKPITILVGRNSAGKSTFLRTFPLLRQSLATKSSAPVLWYGDYVDFGDFKTSVNNNDQKKKISFSFAFSDVNERVRIYAKRSRRIFPLVAEQINVKYSVAAENDKTVLSSIEVEMPNEGISAKLHISSRDQSGSVQVNGVELLKASRLQLRSNNNSLFSPPYLSRQQKGTKEVGQSVDMISTYLEEQLESLLRDVISNNVSTKTIKKEAYRLLGSEKFDSKTLSEWALNSSTQAFRKFYKDFANNMDSFAFQKISAYRKGFTAFAALEFCDEELSGLFSGVSYLGPARARSERYYRKQELEVSEISSDGQNFPSFLSSLSRQRMSEFSKWVEDVFGYGVAIKEDSGHTSIYLTSEENRVNVTDTGYGVSQLLPVLAQVWWSTIHRAVTQRYSWQKSNTKTIAIEQPELHLHPAHQGLLADVFVKAVQTSSTQKIRLVVETHSEAMVNKLGLLIEQGAISPKDVQIVVFGAAETMNSPANVTVAEYDKEGILGNWPYGFFDYL